MRPGGGGTMGKERTPGARPLGPRRAGASTAGPAARRAPLPAAARAWWHRVCRRLVARGAALLAVCATAMRAPSCLAQGGIVTVVNHRERDASAITVHAIWPADSDCLHQPATSDTVEIIVPATLEYAPGAPHLPLPVALRVLDAIRAEIRLPRTLDGGVFGPDTVGVPSVAGAVRFALDRTGAVRDVRLQGESTVPLLDSILPAAVQHAGDAHAFPPFPAPVGQPAMEMTLALSSVQWAATDSLPARMTMFAVAVPRFGKMVRATDLRLPRALDVVTAGSAPPPVDRVSLVQFVIDQDGRPRRTSLRAVVAPSDQIAQRTVALLAHAQLAPARIGQCAVPQLMRLPLALDR